MALIFPTAVVPTAAVPLRDLGLGSSAVRSAGRHESNSTLRLALTALGSHGKQVEVRKPAKDILHDRYVIDDSSMLILGTSLNSFGKRQCLVIKAGPDIRSALLDNFKKLWDSGTVWP